MAARGSLMARRLTVVVVSVASLLVCLALAWWQWERYESASGTWQNLGYVLQWPLFGLFPAFVFFRMRKLRRQAELRDAEGEGPRHEGPVQSVQRHEGFLRGTPPVTQASAEEADDELAAYNRYLAELHARDEQAR